MDTNKLTLFEKAKKEFLEETSDNNSKIVYAYFGLAIFHSQSLELTFKNMLWSIKFINNRNKDLNSILDEIEFSKKTLGGLLREIEEYYSIEENIIKDLKAVLNQRNLLVHNYFNANGQKFCSNKGQLEMLELFCTFIDKVIDLDKKLKVYYKRNIVSLGLTDNTIEDVLTQLMSVEAKRDSEI